MKPRCIILGLLVCWCGYADDWPQWRGANRDGHSSETLPVHGLGESPRILWREAVGSGFSAISVSQNRVYTMGNANDLDTIWCLDAIKGSVLWKKTYPAKLGAVYYEGGPGSTPTVHERKVYTISKWGKVFCLDALAGTEVWNHDLAQEGIKSNRWGFAGSPLIWKDLVIFNAGSAGTALDRNTGRMVWFNGTEPTGYASPMRFITEGTECVLIFAAKHLVAVEPATGKELWRYPWETGYDTNNPDPLIYRNTIFISSYSAGCALLEIDQGKPKLVYRSKVLHNHLSPGILIGEYLYAFNGEAKQSTDFRCIHLPSGEMKWSRKDPAMGSLIAANGKLIILSERGELLVSEASPAGLKTLSRSQLLGGLCWTPPALAEKRLYARNAKGELVCADLTSHESSQ